MRLQNCWYKIRVFYVDRTSKTTGRRKSVAAFRILFYIIGVLLFD